MQHKNITGSDSNTHRETLQAKVSRWHRQKFPDGIGRAIMLCSRQQAGMQILRPGAPEQLRLPFGELWVHSRSRQFCAAALLPIAFDTVHVCNCAQVVVSNGNGQKTCISAESCLVVAKSIQFVQGFAVLAITCRWFCVF